MILCQHLNVLIGLLMQENGSLEKEKSGWPSPDLISKCLMSDCHVVPVGHKCSSKCDKRKEWRISFTGASYILAHSLSFNQRQAFILSKLLIKETLEFSLKRRPTFKNIKLVSSYELKTSFLWLCEEKLAWNNIFVDCHEIVEKLLYFLRKRVLPDYFIPERNIIETLSGEAIEQCMDSFYSILIDDNLLAILNRSLQSCYSDVTNHPLPKVPKIKAVLSEVNNFNESGNPSNRLYMLSIIQFVVDALSATLTNSNRTDNFIDISTIYSNETFLQDLLIGRPKIKSFFNLGLIRQLSFNTLSPKAVQIPEEENENASISTVDIERFECFAELVIDIADNFFDVLSQDFVFEHLQMNIWAPVSLILRDLCIRAGLQYGMRQEVINFESLIKQNSNNPGIVESLIMGYGTKQDLQTNSTICKQKVDKWFQKYAAFAECGLGLYFHSCKKLKLEDTLTFSCYEEKMSVSFAKSLRRDIPEIFDDEMLGSLMLRNRIKLLFNKNFYDLKFSL